MKIEGDEVVYTYEDEKTGSTVEVRLDIPSVGFDEPVVATTPTINDGGKATVTHPDIPGAKVEINLPALGDKYDAKADNDENNPTGNVIYTYTDEDTVTEVKVVVPYDFNDLDWKTNVKPTTESSGTIIGTNEDLPGISFELELPVLSDEDYDIVDNGDGTFTYTLKDKTHEIFSFIVEPEVEEVMNLWPYIVGELILILLLALFANWKKKRNDTAKAAAAASMHVWPAIFLVRYIPNPGILIIVILAVIVALLLGYIVYLFLKCARRIKTSEESEIVKESSGRTIICETIVEEEEETNVPEESVSPVAAVAGSKKMPPLYNYSFQARRHLMDEKTLKLYNMLKNHILSYEGVSVNQTWEHEIFMTSGRGLVRLRFHGKTIKVYLDLNVSDYPEPKFPLIDESKRKIENTTNTLLNVKGPRMAKYALELIDDIANTRGLVKNEAYVEEDFKVKKLDRKSLTNLGLIKVKTMNFDKE